MLIARSPRTQWYARVLSVVLGLALGVLATAALAPSAIAGKTVIVRTSPPASARPPISSPSTPIDAPAGSTASQTISVVVPCAVPRLQHCWPVTDSTVPGAVESR